ncbi:hypothetical protein BGZ72_000118 [Mortierella alpina]|nr:hypothetical protein BGZ72_000118 [Mortierella alpina]
MSRDLFALPELADQLARYLSPPDLFACVQVSHHWNQLYIPHLWHTFDDSLYHLASKLNFLSGALSRSIPAKEDLHKVRNWIRLIFKKYGHLIRVLKMEWDVVLEAASDSGVCTDLVSLEIKLNRYAFWKEQPEHILQNPAAVEAAARARREAAQLDNGLEPPPKRARRTWKLQDLTIGSYDNDWRESHWVVVQNIWTIVELNSRLHSLVIRTNNLSFAETEEARDYIYRTLRHLKHLKKLEAAPYLTSRDLWRLQEYAPQVKVLRGSLLPDVDDHHDLILNPNIESLDVNHFHLSKADAFTLLRIYPNLKHFSFMGLETMNQSSSLLTEPQTPALHLTSLHIRNTLFDLADIVPLCPHLRELGFLVLKSTDTEAVISCKHIETVKRLEYAMFTSNRGRRATDPANRILSACPTLKTFDAHWHYIHADELSRTPWTCSGLETLRCRLVGLERLNKEQEAMYERVSAPGYAVELTAEELAVVSQFDRCRRQQYQVLDRLASLPSLKVLDLGLKNRDPYSTNYYEHDGREYCDYGGPFADTMELTLEAGLERLAGLKNLEVFGFDGADHRIGKRELSWMAEQWPKLKAIRGLAQDDLANVQYDYHKAELRRHMGSLRPDVKLLSVYEHSFQ